MKINNRYSKYGRKCKLYFPYFKQLYKTKCKLKAQYIFEGYNMYASKLYDSNSAKEDREK